MRGSSASTALRRRPHFAGLDTPERPGEPPDALAIACCPNRPLQPAKRCGGSEFLFLSFLLLVFFFSSFETFRMPLSRSPRKPLEDYTSLLKTDRSREAAKEEHHFSGSRFAQPTASLPCGLRGRRGPPYRRNDSSRSGARFLLRAAQLDVQLDFAVGAHPLQQVLVWSISSLHFRRLPDVGPVALREHAPASKEGRLFKHCHI